MMKLDDTFIGKNVRKFRDEKKMTQARLAEIADLSVPYISYIEAGQRRVSLETLCQIADALDVTVNDFLYDNVR